MKIVSIATSRKKGTRKATVDAAYLKKEHGLEGDAHAGTWHRQVSFLASEEIDKARQKGLEVTYQKILIDIKNRDQNDQSRSLAPLVKTEDAIFIDSTDKKIEDVVYLMIREIDR